jgi:3-hydroxybutyryl-CoA dehydrogenase
MNILFTGSTRLLLHWLDLCKDHRCIVYAKGYKNDVQTTVEKVHALDEAPDIDLVIDLHVRLSKKRKLILSDILAETRGKVPILSNTAAVTATEIASLMPDPNCVVGIAALPSAVTSDVVEITYPFGVNVEDRASIEAFLQSIGKESRVVRDEIGMIGPRVTVVMINEALLVLQQNIASEEDIDEILTQELRSAKGPIALGREIGWKAVYNLMLALQDEIGGDRYRPASLLKKLALTN